MQHPYRFVLMMICALLTTGVFANHTLVGQGTLTANDGAPDAYFGQQMVVDETTLAVAAPRANGVGDQSGAVYVFVKNGSSWQFQEKLTASDAGADDNFGATLALSGDTLVVGAPIKQSNTGAVYVFTRTNGDWSQQTKIISPNASSNDFFGTALALEDQILMIGAPGEGTLPEGRVYFYTGSGATWILQDDFKGSDTVFTDFFGASLSLDGDNLLIGAPFKANFTGAAYLFTVNGTGQWEQVTKLSPTNAAQEDFFGWSVALEGNTALVGAPQAVGLSITPNNVPGSGKAYAFAFNGTAWAQQGNPLVASDAGAEERFGWQVILNGNTAYISDDGADETVDYALRADVGAVYTFINNGTGWGQTDKLSPEQQFVDTEFGGSIAFEGTTLFVGAPGVSEDAGTVLIYGEDTPVQTATPQTSTPEPTSTIMPTSTPTEISQGNVELLLNGGFETAESSEALPANWTLKNASKDKRKCNTPDKQLAYDGNCMFQFKSSVGERSKLEQEIDLTQVDLNTGDVLTLSGFVSTKGSVNAKVKVRVTYGSTTLPKGKITIKLNAPSSGYQPLAGNRTIALVDNPTQVKIMLQNRGVSGRVRFDALSLNKETGTAFIPLP